MFGAIFFSSANKVTECETYGIYPWSGSNIDFSWTPRAEILFFPILTSLGDEKNLCQRIWGKKSISLTVFGINSFYCTQCLNCICIDLFVNCLDKNNSWLFWILHPFGRLHYFESLWHRHKFWGFFFLVGKVIESSFNINDQDIQYKLKKKMNYCLCRVLCKNCCKRKA